MRNVTHRYALIIPRVDSACQGGNESILPLALKTGKPGRGLTTFDPFVRLGVHNKVNRGILAPLAQDGSAAGNAEGPMNDISSGLYADWRGVEAHPRLTGSRLPRSAGGGPVLRF
jgi:hypothetical protein